MPPNQLVISVNEHLDIVGLAVTICCVDDVVRGEHVLFVLHEGDAIAWKLLTSEIPHGLVEGGVS